MEEIKTLLGEALSAQVSAALKGKGKNGADVELAISSNGSYVPAQALETERQGRASAENALKAAAAALKGIGGSGDPAKIGADVAAAQQKLIRLEETHKAELVRLQKTTALKLGLAGKAHDPNDIIRLLDLEKIQLDEKGGLKESLEELTKPIQEAKPYLFVAEKPAPPAVAGVKPAQPGSGAPPADPGKMTYGEFEAYITAHPNAQF